MRLRSSCVRSQPPCRLGCQPTQPLSRGGQAQIASLGMQPKLSSRLPSLSRPLPLCRPTKNMQVDTDCSVHTQLRMSIRTLTYPVQVFPSLRSQRGGIQPTSATQPSLAQPSLHRLGYNAPLLTPPSLPFTPVSSHNFFCCAVAFVCRLVRGTYMLPPSVSWATYKISLPAGYVKNSQPRLVHTLI